MLSHDEIFNRVATTLEEALNVERDQITPEATLVGDLGAESIDFLDINFRLEREFGIKIPRTELFPDDVTSNPEYVQDGKITPQGLAELRERMPFADLSKLEQNPDVRNITDIFTVDVLTRFVEMKLEEAQQKTLN
jgi:acyl carrier protein